MRLSINGRVVKNCDVEVSTPRMVECHEGFQQLGSFLTVLRVGEEQPTKRLNPSEIVAQENASRILEEAEIGARTLLEEARADSDRLRQEVVEKAQAEVYPAAQEAGYQAGFEVGEVEGKRLAEKAHQLFQLAQHAVQEEYAKVDETLLHLAIKIAERIVRSSLAVEPQRLMATIQALTLLPQERVGWRLHVAPADTACLEGNQLTCPWIVDESLKPGDCFLECEEGIFDAQLEAQLDKLEHILREELEHGSVDAIDAYGGTD
ncbi:MAG TPA: FliH/SctL family protein [Desulfosporosinus sp.]|nr:FliH/SctL family protein [Desulfosporosinus sp.]